MPSIVFRRLAKREFDDAISWYEGRRQGLGQDFSVAVERQLERIAHSPTNSRGYEEIYAKLCCDVFSIPYSLSRMIVGS